MLGNNDPARSKVVCGGADNRFVEDDGNRRIDSIKAVSVLRGLWDEAQEPTQPKPNYHCSCWDANGQRDFDRSPLRVKPRHGAHSQRQLPVYILQ
jgi:hypothetical protein